MQTITREQHYEAYQAAERQIIDAKAQIKALNVTGEQAALKARRETPGSTDDKLAAIQAAWKPFNEQIAALEQRITEQYEIADREFDSWKELDNEQIIIEELEDDEQESVTEGENEDGEENPEIEVAEKTTKEQTREEWLASLKPGDQVAITRSYQHYEFYIVERVTPSGQIVLDNGKRYNKDGEEMNAHTVRWNREVLHQVTARVLEDEKRYQVYEKMSKLLENRRSLDHLDTKALDEILALLMKHAGGAK